MPLAGGAVALIATLTHWFPNMNRLPYEDAVPTIAVMLAIAAAVTILLRPIAGSWAGAGLMSGVIAVYCLYLPAPVAAISAAMPVQALCLALGAIVAVLIARRVPRDADAAADVNRKINILLVSVALGMAGAAAIKQVRAEAGRPDPQSAFMPFDGQARPDSPDVWHIVFDRYAGSETLQRAYGYDNRPFLEALRARGFAVDESAHANYQRTAHSVASTLNGDYLDRLGGGVALPNDWVPLYRAMTGNQALRFFRAQGYQTVFAGSWWNPTRRSALADRNINYRSLPELARVVIDESAPGLLLRWTGLPFGDARGDQCRRAPHKFASLRELAGEDGRKYVFAHFLVPHPPFVLNADGSCRSLAQAGAATRRDNYIAQLEYVNREALRLIDAIRAGPRPAAIVIHADEGPWPEPFVGDERFIGRDPVSVDWAELDGPRLREKMGILMAILPADARPIDLPRSPVNIYPAILRSYFGYTSPVRPDRHFVFEGDRTLYRFRDVGVLLGPAAPTAGPSAVPAAQAE